MCTPAAAIMAVGTGVQMSAAKKQGKAEKIIADMNAKNALIDKAQSDLEGKQFTNDRLQMYDDDMATNDALFAFLGRDMPSEFQEAQKLKAFTDVARGSLRTTIQGSQSLADANMSLVKGKYAQKTASMRATTSLLSGVNNLLNVVG
jgi:hypothetical protein